MFKPELRKQDIQFEHRLDYSYIDYNINWAIADLTRISQVVINLFSNAIKFTTQKPGKKKIALSMGASLERPQSYPPDVVFFKSEEAALRLDATNRPEWGKGEGAYILVAVSDTGVGISDESQRRLFQRFNQGAAQTEMDYGGSGLGLNVCRKLCHLHGGEIGVSSEKGQGSTFGFSSESAGVHPHLTMNLDRRMTSQSPSCATRLGRWDMSHLSLGSRKSIPSRRSSRK